MHGELRGSVVKAPGWTALPLLLVEDEGGVLLLGDVDVVAGVRGGHDVARARVQQDALVLLPLYTDQADAVPAGHTPAVSGTPVIIFTAGRAYKGGCIGRECPKT